MYNKKINVIYLKDASNLQELKKLYFSLSKKYHPDITKNPADEEVMKIINNEYDYLKTILHNATDTKTAEKETTASMEAFKDILDILLQYPKITIEIIGSWLWISGTGTYNIKDAVLYNQLHCKYSKSNKKFYWFSGIEDQNYKCKGGFLKKAIENYGITKYESNSIQYAIA